MLLLTLISIVRYLINGFFTFSIFNDSKNSVFKKIFIPTIIYTIFLITFKKLIIDSPIITVISAITTFGCLLLTTKLKTWNCMITYSLFMSCLQEYSHFLIFKIVSKIWENLGIPDVTYTPDINLMIFRSVALSLYAVAILLIYKLNKIDVKSVFKLADYKIFPMFLSVALCIIIYLKYYIKYTHSNEFHDILSVIFVFFIVVSLIFIFSSKTFLETVDKFQKKKLNLAIEEAKSRKGKGYSGMNFESKELNSEMEYFQNELENICMDKEDKKAKQISFCAVLLNHEENPQSVNMRLIIYSPVGEILGRLPKSIESNIGNALQNLWDSCDPKTLKKIEQNYHGPISPENGAPTPKEFLIYLVKKYREDNIVNESNYKIQHSFFKRCILDICNGSISK